MEKRFLFESPKKNLPIILNIISAQRDFEMLLFFCHVREWRHEGGGRSGDLFFLYESLFFFKKKNMIDT